MKLFRVAALETLIEKVLRNVDSKLKWDIKKEISTCKLRD